MAKAAIAGFNKTMKKCPNCGTQGPKDIVGGPKRVNWIMFIILLLFTAGVGLLYVPWWYKSSLEAYCPACNKSFGVSSV